ncbi:hypothetical protein AVEN_219036-1 [Araneus ventricosus]|uniref:Uncharacterized protein n=1 Tax=Araneus ventricosus TaxID=182803 RepID=A0A4Y2RF95_ARAVE|nr:hypothetical protein AVEN_219036-1 [Araneus ventricosus]
MLAASQLPEVIYHRAPKELTEEASNMIYVILAFVGLAVLGSSVTAYEVFFKDNGKKCESHKNGYNERTAKPTLTVLKERKSVASHGNILF